MKPASILWFVSVLLIILAPTLDIPPASAQTNPPVYLIIAPDEFRDALNPFIALKASQGLQPELALLSETGPAATDIWNFIQGYTPRPKYVLLVGDTDLIPAGTIDTDPKKPACSQKLTDLYYAILDHTCGPVPDLILGRLPVHDSIQLSKLIDKYLAFAAAPPDSTWRNKLSFVASNEQNKYAYYEDSHTKVIEKYTSPRGFKGTFTRTGASIDGGDRLYPAGHQANQEDLFTALNEGRLAVTYYGPGSAASWDWITLDPFTTAEVAALTGPPVPLVFALAPGTADFSVGTSMADAWLNHPTGGALAYIGSSFDPSFNGSATFLEFIFWQEILANPAATMSIGEALHAALAQLTGTLEPQTAKSLWEAYQILGDPSLRVIPCQCGRLWSSYAIYRGALGENFHIPVTLTNLDILPRSYGLRVDAPAAFGIDPNVVADLAPGKSIDFYIDGMIPWDISSSSGDILVTASSGIIEAPLIIHVEADLQKIYLPIVHR